MVATLAVVFGTTMPVDAMEPGTTTVGGSWVNVLACVFTSFDPATGAFTCTSSSTWEGSWTGITHFDAEGVIDPATGDLRGTFTETFIGTHLADRSMGSLTFVESFTVEGATGAVLIEADIVRGSGDPTFGCSSGHATFDGFAAPAAGSSLGGWRGTWTHGCLSTVMCSAPSTSPERSGSPPVGPH